MLVLMRPGTHNTRHRAVGTLLALCCLGAFPLFAPAAAPAAARLHPAAAATNRGEEGQVARYWTAARIRTTPPLDEAARGAPLTALASFAPVAEPTVPP